MATAAIAGVGLVLGEVTRRKGVKAQKKAAKIQGKKADLQNARSRRQQVAQARIQRARTIAQGESQGLSGGSQVAGATSSLGTQAATNVSFLNQLQGFDQARFKQLDRAGSAFALSQSIQAVAQFATSSTGQEIGNQAKSFFKG